MTPDDGGVGRPVSFRARPQLADQLEARNNKVGTAARLDLARYYDWLADELATVDVKPDDADRLLTALHDVAHTREGLTLHHYLVVELERHAPGQAIIQTAHRWTPGQARAVLDAVQRAWRDLDRDADRPTRIAALRRTGLIKDA